MFSFSLQTSETRLNFTCFTRLHDSFNTMARTWEELDYCLDECKYQSVLYTKKPIDFTHSQ